MNYSIAILPKTSIVNRAYFSIGLEHVVKWDVWTVQDGAKFRLFFESTEVKKTKHGVWLMTDDGIIVNGTKMQSVDIWNCAESGTVDIEVRTKDGRLHAYNIWDIGEGRNSQAWTSGMIVENLPMGRRYRCNDVGLSGEFTSIIFRIERV